MHLHVRKPRLPRGGRIRGQRWPIGSLMRTEDNVTARELVDRLTRGDATTVSVVKRNAAVLGRAIADLVNFCNPARVVIGGEVTLCTEDVLSQIRSVVYQQAQPLATRNLSIVHSDWGTKRD